MEIRRFQRKDTKKVASLISKTYKRFNSSDYFDKKSAEKYIKLFDPEQLKKIFLKYLTRQLSFMLL